MPVTHANRKGYIYYLCQGMTKTDKLRYYFARPRRTKTMPRAEVAPPSNPSGDSAESGEMVKQVKEFMRAS